MKHSRRHSTSSVPGRLSIDTPHQHSHRRGSVASQLKHSQRRNSVGLIPVEVSCWERWKPDRQKLEHLFRHPRSRVINSMVLFVGTFIAYSVEPIMHAPIQADPMFIGTAVNLVSFQSPGPPETTITRITLIVVGTIVAFLIAKLFQVAVKSYLYMFRCDSSTIVVALFLVLPSLYGSAMAYNAYLDSFMSPENKGLYSITQQLDGVTVGLLHKVKAAIAWISVGYMNFTVLDDVLQESSHYPGWGKSRRRLWTSLWGGMFRVFVCWIFVLGNIATAACLWFDLPFLNLVSPDSPTTAHRFYTIIGITSLNELQRTLVTSSILVLHVVQLAQDWSFPTWVSRSKLPGLSASKLYCCGTSSQIPLGEGLQQHVRERLEWLQRYSVDGKWVYLGVSLLALTLVLYSPTKYGQYSVGETDMSAGASWSMTTCSSIITLYTPENLVLNKSQVSILDSYGSTTIDSFSPWVLGAQHCGFELRHTLPSIAAFALVFMMFVYLSFKRGDRVNHATVLPIEPVEVVVGGRPRMRQAGLRRSSLPPPSSAFWEREKIARTDSGTRLL